MKFKGITLAEVLTACAIMGLVAMITIPAIITGNQQTRYKTGLRKAVDTISGAIQLNVAKGEKSAYYTNSTNTLFYYLQKNLKVRDALETSLRDSSNMEFTTKDDTRYEFPNGNSGSSEFNNIKIKDNNGNSAGWSIKDSNCGTMGLGIGGSADVQSVQPCMILVDVNGDNPPNTLTSDSETSLSDMFLLIVTDKNVLPYGTLAQRAYYGDD